MDKKALTLQDALCTHSAKELREIASRYSVKVTNKMRKDEMVTVVEKAILDVSPLEQLLLMLDEAGWEFFQAVAAADGPIEVSFSDKKFAQLFYERGYILYKREETPETAEMPVEVKCLFGLMRTEGFVELKVRADILHAYSQAAVNLYGLIRTDELLEIFNRQNEKDADKAELLFALRPHLDTNAYYCLWEDYLVSISFREDDFEYINQFLTEISGLPRYVPAKESFLRYADDNFYERTIHTAQLEKLLVEGWSLTPDVAQGIVSKVVFSIQAGTSTGESFQVLINHGIAVQEKLFHTVMCVLAGIHNTSRLWTTKGFTPDELAKLLDVTTNGVVNIGRNDPCPCGSGKKYKKCCGR